MFRMSSAASAEAECLTNRRSILDKTAIECSAAKSEHAREPESVIPVRERLVYQARRISIGTSRNRPFPFSVTRYFVSARKPAFRARLYERGEGYSAAAGRHPHRECWKTCVFCSPQSFRVRRSPMLSAARVFSRYLAAYTLQIRNAAFRRSMLHV